MARPTPGGNTKRAPKNDAARNKTKKVCQFCKDKTAWIDYKDVNLLRRFMSDRGKIRARRVTGNCSQHQRDIAVAVKTGREIALLPYSQRTTTERGGGGRGPRGDRRNESGPRSDRNDAGAGSADGGESSTVVDESEVLSVDVELGEES